MESSDYTRLDYKTINEFFPKGQLSILAAGPQKGNCPYWQQDQEWVKQCLLPKLQTSFAVMERKPYISVWNTTLE